MTDIDNNQEIIGRFREWLKSQSITETEISKTLHVSISHLNNILNGRRTPNTELFEKIKMLLNIKTSLYKKDSRHKQFAEELHTWFSNQSKWKTQKELADDIHLPYGTIKNYFQGIKIPRGKNRKILYDLTKIESIIDKKDINKINIIKFEPEHITKKSGDLTIYFKNIELCLKTISENIQIIRNTSTQYHPDIFSNIQKKSTTQRTAFLFYALAKELINFRKSTKTERDELRKFISAKDLGYIISFLKAIYDEDKFSDFIFFTEYDLEGGSKIE